MSDHGNNSTDTLQKTVGRSIVSGTLIDMRTFELLQCTLGPSETGTGVLSPLWHWCFFPPMTSMNELGEDGHPELGQFIPDFGLPRRMWAGGRLLYFEPITVGDQLTRKTTISKISSKEGRSGKLCFVTLDHLYLCNDKICIREEQDIVYREAMTDKTGVNMIGSSRSLTPPHSSVSEHSKNDEQMLSVETFQASSVLLFRYSALTFNSHRIHYDRDYSTKVEGYPGLVVHGPLIATLLAGFSQRFSKGRKLVSFQFKAQSPIFDGEVFHLNGRDTGDGVDLSAINPLGIAAMTASSTFG